MICVSVNTNTIVPTASGGFQLINIPRSWCSNLPRRLLSAPGTAGSIATVGGRMKSVKAIVASSLAAAVFASCDGNPVEPNSVAQLTVSPGRVVVGVGQWSGLTVTVRDASGAVQCGVSLRYVSRDQTVAAVNGNGTISGVAAGSMSSLRSRTARRCVTPFAFAYRRDTSPVRSYAPATCSPMTSMRQNGRFGKVRPEALHAAAPEPGTIRWYDAGHSPDQLARVDRHVWLNEQIGLDPLK